MGYIIRGPEDITTEQMRDHADHISRYLDLLLSHIIIPKGMNKRKEEKFREDIKTVKKLIKKLKKGDKSVFKDEID